jgi:hypothetical protein
VKASTVVSSQSNPRPEASELSKTTAPESSSTAESSNSCPLNLPIKIPEEPFREVHPNNVFNDAVGDRTLIDLVAPGTDIEVSSIGDQSSEVTGTSFAAPHVTGTVALLQQFANQRIASGTPRWDATRSRRHETMKAVLMNSADKLIDDGTIMIAGNPVPQGYLLGMERTVIDQNGLDWRQSEANDDSIDGQGFVPLDDQMGAGHLNAKRALQQFRNGEFDSDGNDVPLIGWDYGQTTGQNDNNQYRLAQKLLGGSFISITLAWDRVVEFANDVDMDGQYDPQDTFQESHVGGINPPNDDQINDLDLYLVERGDPINQAIASSNAIEGTLEHIFFQVPSTGFYDFYVSQLDADIAGGQDYAVAWWAVTLAGDFNGDDTVDHDDYTQWKMDYGTTNLASDGNGDGDVNAADYTVWRNNLGATLGTGSVVLKVPEPGAAILFLFGIAITGFRSNRKASCKRGRNAY